MKLRGFAACVIAVAGATGSNLSATALDSGSKVGSGRPVNVSGTATDSLTPVVASEGELVHVAWIESEPTTDGLRATIWYVRSTDAGRTFEASRPVAPLTGYASGLQCSVDGSTVHLAWLATSYTTGSPAAVDYQRSTDGGVTFEPLVAVQCDAPPGVPVLAVSSGRVAAVWLSDNRIWVARSIDGGASFQCSMLTVSGLVAEATSVRVDSLPAAVAVAWIEPGVGSGGRLHVGRLDWETGTFAESQSPEGAGVSELAIAVYVEQVVIAWTGSGTGRTVKAARSTDGGKTFGDPVELGGASSVAGPKVAVSGETAYLTWVDDRGRLGTGVWAQGGVVRLVDSPSGKGAVFPEIVADGEGALVVWRSGSGAASRVRSGSVREDEESSVVRAVSRRGRSAAAPRADAGGSARMVAWQELVRGSADVFVRRLEF